MVPRTPVSKRFSVVRSTESKLVIAIILVAILAYSAVGCAMSAPAPTSKSVSISEKSSVKNRRLIKSSYGSLIETITIHEVHTQTER